MRLLIFFLPIFPVLFFLLFRVFVFAFYCLLSLSLCADFRFFLYHESLVVLFSVRFIAPPYTSTMSLFFVHVRLVVFLFRSFGFVLLVYVEGWLDWLGLRKEIRCPNIWTVDRGTCPFSMLEIRSTGHSLQRLAPFPRRQIDRDIAASGELGPPSPLSHSVAHGFASARLRNSSSSSFDRLPDPITANCDLFSRASRTSPRLLSANCQLWLVLSFSRVS